MSKRDSQTNIISAWVWKFSNYRRTSDTFWKTKPHISQWSWNSSLKWTRRPSHRATRADTRYALCPPPEGGKLSLWRKLWATVNYVTSKSPDIRIPRKKALTHSPQNRPCGSKSFLPLVTSSVLTVKAANLCRVKRSFKTIPEWAQFSQGHRRKRQKNHARLTCNSPWKSCSIAHLPFLSPNPKILKAFLKNSSHQNEAY